MSLNKTVSEASLFRARFGRDMTEAEWDRFEHDGNWDFMTKHQTGSTQHSVIVWEYGIVDADASPGSKYRKLLFQIRAKVDCTRCTWIVVDMTDLSARNWEFKNPMAAQRKLKSLMLKAGH